MMHHYIAAEQSGAEFEFRSMNDQTAWKRAMAWHREGDYDTEPRTFWTELWLHRVTRDGKKEMVRRELVQWDPVEPLCDPEHPHKRHDWRQVCAGGHGGGVIVESKCRRCACLRFEDTWHSLPDGSIGDSTEYVQ